MKGYIVVKNNLKKWLALGFVSCFFAALSFCPNNSFCVIPGAQAGTLKNNVVTVPAGQVFSAIVTAPISSANLTLGQQVNLVLSNNFVYNSKLIAPAGSAVVGNVISVSKSGNNGKNGELLLRFTRIITPYGIQIPLAANIKNASESGVLKGFVQEQEVPVEKISNKGYDKDLQVTNRCEICETAQNNNTNKGVDVEIPVRSQLDLILTQPITVNPAMYDSNY